MTQSPYQISLFADPQWNQPCLGYSVQAQFDDAAVASLGEVQHRLARACPVSLHIIPPHALHISVYPIIPARWQHDRADQLWDEICAACMTELERAKSEDARLDVRFESVCIKPSAFILTTPDQSGVIGAVRKRFAKLLADRGMPEIKFDRTHVTVAKPAGDAVLSADEALRIEALMGALPLRLSSVQIVRETIYPSLSLTPVKHQRSS